MVLSGPSAGVGKDTILKMFLQKHPDWIMPASTTTRAPRDGEVDGRDMNFIDQDTFDKWKYSNKFLEAIRVDDGKWYGTLRQPVEDALEQGKSVILRVDVKGALVIKEKIPQAFLVFMNAESIDALEARMRSRGTEDESSIVRRLDLAKKEMGYQDRYDKIVINHTGRPDQALADLEAAIGAQNA